MTIDIQEICSRWNISRPTVMKAVSERKLVGKKNRQGKWGFETANVVLWRGEPLETENAYRATAAPPTAVKPAETGPMLLLMKTMEDYIKTLKGQLEVKDIQLADTQDTMREQMRLLTFVGPALTSTNEEIVQLKQELAAKEVQLEKVMKATAEQVSLLLKVPAAENLQPEEVDTVADITRQRTKEVQIRMQKEKVEAEAEAEAEVEDFAGDFAEDFDHWDGGALTDRQKMKQKYNSISEEKD
jgi:hypothetical protein